METRGTDATDPESCIVGIGLANDKLVGYLDMKEVQPADAAAIYAYLGELKLTAFNVMFDGAFLQGACGRWLNWVGDSYALFKQLSGEGFTGQTWDLETAQHDVLGWEVSNKDALAAALKERGLTKADMWQLPTEILGPYCASDADAAWQLWHVLADKAAEHAAMPDYHTRIFMPQIRLLAEQQFRGISVNQSALSTCHTELLAGIQSSMQSFLTHPQVAPHVAEYNGRIHAAWKAAEPPATTKAGKPSARWESWAKRENVLPRFNPNSKIQLEELFFDKMGFKPATLTEGGRRSIDRKVLPSLGEPGKVLTEYNALVKRRGYVEAMQAKTARDGILHPQFKSVGTVTGRLGGSGGLNLQQMPKDPAFLHCLGARPGYVLLDADAEALEPTILAEFSQDRTLLSLYGAGAKPNDIYLYVASKIPALGREILKYYDPDNPTPEGIAAAKKYCKRARSIAKIVVLAANYNAMPPKIHETLTLGGIDISLREVREIYREYWRLFAGVKEFEQRLVDLWTENGGWIPSVLGTPICVAPALVKDINNRFCQTSGHLFLQLWIYYIDKLRTERGLTEVMHPWIMDFHDETCWEIEEAHAEAGKAVLADALAMANEEVGMGILIKGKPETAATFGELKCEGYADWLESAST